MEHRFREIRKGECDAVLGFAKEQGCAIKPETLHHHLSLAVKAEDDLVAAALCVEIEPDHFVIEIAHKDAAEDTLITELADRCLRKVQAQGIASARIKSPTDTATQTIWQYTNWLDRIEETPPPDDVSLHSDAA
ncbi:MAG: hypothetical protein AAF085_08390 [Planctomycetota bacterium]